SSMGSDRPWPGPGEVFPRDPRFVPSGDPGPKRADGWAPSRPGECRPAGRPTFVDAARSWRVIVQSNAMRLLLARFKSGAELLEFYQHDLENGGLFYPTRRNLENG